MAVLAVVRMRANRVAGYEAQRDSTRRGACVPLLWATWGCNVGVRVLG